MSEVVVVLSGEEVDLLLDLLGGAKRSIVNGEVEKAIKQAVGSEYVARKVASVYTNSVLADIDGLISKLLMAKDQKKS